MVKFRALIPMAATSMFGSHSTSAWLRITLVLVVGLSVPNHAFGSDNLLQNGDFSTGVQGWSLETNAGFELSWDPVRGQPPGSLRLSGTFRGFGSPIGEALSECFDPAPGTLFEAQARVLAETTDGHVLCVPFITRYEGSGCTGERARFGATPTIEGNETSVWRSMTALAQTSAGLPSFRVSLVFWRLSGVESASCNFDSVVLAEAGTTEAHEVPVTSEVGLVLLIALLGLSAVWLLRTRP